MCGGVLNIKLFESVIFFWFGVFYLNSRRSSSSSSTKQGIHFFLFIKHAKERVKKKTRKKWKRKNNYSLLNHKMNLNFVVSDIIIHILKPIDDFHKKKFIINRSMSSFSSSSLYLSMCVYVFDCVCVSVRVFAIVGIRFFFCIWNLEKRKFQFKSNKKIHFPKSSNFHSSQ